MRALACRWWEVRNSATMTLTSLVLRVVGFKNTGEVAAGQAGKKAITSKRGEWREGRWRG